LHASDHGLPEWVQFHTLASALTAALLAEEAGGEVDLGTTNTHNSEELDEGHPALASCGCISR